MNLTPSFCNHLTRSGCHATPTFPNHVPGSFPTNLLIARGSEQLNAFCSLSTAEVSRALKLSTFSSTHLDVISPQNPRTAGSRTQTACHSFGTCTAESDQVLLHADAYLNSLFPLFGRGLEHMETPGSPRGACPGSAEKRFVAVVLMMTKRPKCHFASSSSLGSGSPRKGRTIVALSAHLSKRGRRRRTARLLAGLASPALLSCSTTVSTILPVSNFLSRPR